MTAMITLSRAEYEQTAHAQGFGAPKEVSFAPMSRSAPHTHDQISFIYVLAGTFILNTDAGAPAYTAGQTCMLAANVSHQEEAGPDGATILVARK